MPHRKDPCGVANAGPALCPPPSGPSPCRPRPLSCLLTKGGLLEASSIKLFHQHYRWEGQYGKNISVSNSQTDQSLASLAWNRDHHIYCCPAAQAPRGHEPPNQRNRATQGERGVLLLGMGRWILMSSHLGSSPAPTGCCQSPPGIFAFFANTHMCVHLRPSLETREL